jgi:putative tricarboxylic transport membrane protein
MGQGDETGGSAAAPDAGAAGEEPSVSTRGPELGLALVLMLLAGLVLADSLRVGIGWGDDGPRSGYFPFYIGLLLLGSAGWTFVTTLLKGRAADEDFATRGQLASVAQVGAPMVVYVAVMTVMGLYVASIALIGYFMRRHGRYGWALTAAVSVGVPLVAFLVFERWFLVPLPKGPIENWLGF